MRRRLIAGALFVLVWGTLYKLAQTCPLRTAQVRLDSAAWHYVPFQPAWTWLYLSMIALVALAWLLVPHADFARFRFHLYLLATIGGLCFFVWPTEIARPHAVDPPWSYRALIAADTPANSFPCMHAAFSVLAATAIAVRFHGWPRALVVFVTTSWVLAIGWSIVAVRQHAGSDIAWGFALGSAIAMAFVRGRTPVSAL